MSRLAYIFYVYIKANTHQTPPKLIKAIEEIQNARRDLPLHLSHHFPANEDDKQWEIEHPWVPFQRYLVTLVLDFLELGIARVLVTRDTQDDPARFRKIAIASANRILRSYATTVPRVYRLVWTVSAATVAASVYISLDMIANPHDYRGDVKAETIEILGFVALELKRHAEVAVHAAKGSTMIERLLFLINQEPPAISHPPRTVHDLVQELSSSNQQDVFEDVNLIYEDPVAAYMGILENEDTLSQLEAPFEHMSGSGMNEWDEFILGL
jgi:hypothetical protein